MTPQPETPLAELHFYTQGPVPADQPTYIRRVTDQMALTYLQRQDYVTVIAPRQMGKTSLLHKLRNILNSNGIVTILLDMSVYNNANATWKDWIRMVGKAIEYQLRNDLDITDEITYPENPSGLIGYFAKLVSRLKNRANVTFFLDEAAAVPTSIRDDFYGVIRSIKVNRNQRLYPESIDRCNFVFAGVFEPELLVSNKENSPFNISRIIKLSDFTLAETQQLLGKLPTASLTDAFIANVYKLTNGHPNLVQHMANVAQMHLLETPTAILTAASAEQFAIQVMDDARDNIDHMVKLVLNTENPSVFEFMSKCLNGETLPFARGVQPASNLELFGAIAGGNGKCWIRNPLYANALKNALQIMNISENNPEILQPLSTPSNPQQISIVFLAADPTNASRLRLGEELREIQEKLQLARLRDTFQLHQRMSVRPTDISQALLDIQPQIVHFSGHGTMTGALCFESVTGEIQPVAADALAALFEQFADRINCILLNACYSEIQANAIAQYIPYVIGMNQAIGDKAAVAFAIGFYQAVGAGRTVEESYKLGCVQIRLHNLPEHLAPVLIKKGQEQAWLPPNPAT